MIEESAATNTKDDELEQVSKPIAQRPQGNQGNHMGFFPVEPTAPAAPIPSHKRVQRQENLVKKRRGAPHIAESKSGAFHSIGSNARPTGSSISPLTDSDFEDEKTVKVTHTHQSKENSRSRMYTQAKYSHMADEEEAQVDSESCEF